MSTKLPSVKIRRLPAPDWELRLLEWAWFQIGKPFVWNKTNCAALLAGAADAMCGSDLYNWQKSIRLSPVRSAALSRNRFVRRSTLAVGCSAVPVEKISRGDFLLATESVKTPGGKDVLVECAHICLGAEALSCSPDRGVFLLPVAVLVAEARDLEVFRCPL